MSAGPGTRHRPHFFDPVYVLDGKERDSMIVRMALALSETDLDEFDAVFMHLLGCRFDVRDINECIDEAIRIAKTRRES